MDRLRQIGDAIKNRYSKPCCVKLSVGIAVGLVVLVVVVVVAVTVGEGGGGGGDREEGGGGVTSRMKTDTEGDDARPSVTESPRLSQSLEWPHQFDVQLTSQRFSQIMAVDDVTRRYVIEINNNRYYNLYVIVDFRKRQHTYVIMEKRGNDVTTKVVYCDSSPFGNDYDGAFTPSAALREGGTSYRQQVGGRTITVNADYMDKPYKVSSILVRILRGSCGNLSADTLFQWNTKLSACGDNTTLPGGSPACPNLPCPRFKPQKISKSTQEACDSFRKCNYVMSACDSSWTQPYDQRPYCACRRALIDDVSNINCPDVGSEGSEGGGGVCTIPKREIEDFEKMAACYCRYRISRIYPKISTGSTKSVSWEIKATVRTAPIKSYEHCSC